MEAAMEGDGRRVLGTVQGGPTQFAQSIRFDLKFEDGSVEPFHIRYEDLPKFVHALRAFGSIAEKARKAMPAQTIDLVTPYEVTNSMTGTASNGAIAIRFGTKDGIPLEVAMTRRQTKTLVEQLRSELKKVTPRAD
jgi:hypothetical protein